MALLDCSTATIALGFKLFVVGNDVAVCSKVMLGIVLAILANCANVVIWREAKLLATLVFVSCSQIARLPDT